MKSIHPYILIASSPAILFISPWRDGRDGTAISRRPAISDGWPWRDGTSRDSEPRNDPLPFDVDVPRPSAVSPVLPVLLSRREVWEDVGLPILSGLPEAMSWRDAKSRDLAPR
ncbi:hypothetical protein BM1_02461 [Bipolaris maydis]|nr:hypothetical protein BM1_02461 [Bipolaris maydis]